MKNGHPLSTLEAGYRLMMHGLDVEGLHGWLRVIKRRQPANRSTLADVGRNGVIATRRLGAGTRAIARRCSTRPSWQPCGRIDGDVRPHPSLPAHPSEGQVQAVFVRARGASLVMSN
jgi:hypothetical protein